MNVKVELVPLVPSLKYEWVQCSNGFREFDSHTTTKKYKIMTIINKITGRDISTEYLGLMSGLITRDEFELITLTIK